MSVISFQTKRVCAERGGGRAMALLQLCRVHIPVCNSTNSPIALLLDNNGANNSSQSAHLTAFSNSASCYHHGVDVRLFASSSSSNRRGATAGSLLQVLFFLSPPQNCSAETMFFFSPPHSVCLSLGICFVTLHGGDDVLHSSG